MSFELVEVDLKFKLRELPARITALVEDGLHRSRRIDCFDFVPSKAAVLHAILDTLPRGRYCEWGSGIGIGVGVADLLGFAAHGIEIDDRLVAESQRLLGDHGLAAIVERGDYFEQSPAAEYYFVYCWPGQIRRTEERFLDVAPLGAMLLLAHGAEDIRATIKQSPVANATAI
jgi:hypothetical protein